MRMVKIRIDGIIRIVLTNEMIQKKTTTIEYNRKKG